MQNVILSLILLCYIGLGFLVMNRWDRFRNENYEITDESEAEEKDQAGK